MTTPSTPPPGSSIYIEHDGGCDRIVMPAPTNHTGRIIGRGLLLVFVLVVGAIWLGAVGHLFTGHEWGIELYTVCFMTAMLALLWSVCRRAFRRRVPESITLLDHALLHDTGVDPFRMSERERGSYERQNAQVWKPRTRTLFSAEECRRIAMANTPYKNRIYIENSTGRHDIGEALSGGERAWLFDYLRARLKIGPATMSPRAAALAREVHETDRARPPSRVTDIYSEHFVDPLDFDDPVARQADWDPLHAFAASFRSFDLHTHAGIARFKATATNRGSTATPLIAGLMLLLAAYKDFLGHGSSTLSGGGAVSGVLGLVFVILGVYAVRGTVKPIVFDARRRTFRGGRRGRRNARVIGFDEIKGIQLLSTVMDGSDGNFTVFEMNLLLADRTRVPVVCHGDIDAIRQQAAAVAAMVDVPVFDGIKAVGSRARPRQVLRSESPLTALIGYAPALLMLGIFFQVLMAPVAVPSREPKHTQTHHAGAQAPMPVSESTPVEVSPNAHPALFKPRRRTFELAAPPGVGPSSRAAEMPRSEKEWARLEETVAALAESAIHLEEVGHTTGTLRVRGYAPDNMSIAAFLRKLKRVGAPKLHIITKVSRDGREVNEFIISIEGSNTNI